MKRQPIDLDDTSSELALPFGDAGTEGFHTLQLYPRPPGKPLSLTALDLEPLYDTSYAYFHVASELDVQLIHLGGNHFASHFPGQSELIWEDLALLFGSLGETGIIATAALRDLASHAASRTNPAVQQQVDFILEAVEHYLLSAGHQLLNIAFRLCAAHPGDVHKLVSSRKWRSSVDALQTSARDQSCGSPLQGSMAWPQHARVRDLVDVLGSRTRSAGGRVALAALHLLGTPAWQAITRQRNVAYHRHRRAILYTPPLLRTVPRFDAALDAAQDLGYWMEVALQAIIAGMPVSRLSNEHLVDWSALSYIGPVSVDDPRPVLELSEFLPDPGPSMKYVLISRERSLRRPVRRSLVLPPQIP